MTFKPAVWYPLAAALSAVNVAAVWFAARPGEPWHATVHAVLAVGFGLWAQRLRQARQGGELEMHLDPLVMEVSSLRQELADTQDRLDFAERILAQARDPSRSEPADDRPDQGPK